MFVWWIACVVAVGVLASAQGRQNTAVISGNDIGFRPDAVQRSRERISETLVVRVNGQWMEAQFSAARAVPATE